MVKQFSQRCYAFAGVTEDVAMKLYLGEALSLLLKTLPFIWIRLGTYALLGLGLAVYFAIAAGIAWLLGNLFRFLGIIVFAVAIWAHSSRLRYHGVVDDRPTGSVAQTRDRLQIGRSVEHALGLTRVDHRALTAEA